MLLTIILVLSLSCSIVDAQLSQACAAACNLALCFDSSDSISRDDYKILPKIVDRINDITIGNNKKYHLGFVIYAGDIGDDRTCFMYPPNSGSDFKTCTSNAFNPDIRDRESTHLEKCFDRLNTHPRFWKTAYSACKYNVIVLTDGNTSDMKEAAYTGKLLRAKGVRIICYTTSFDEDDYDYRHEYSRICDKLHKIKDIQTFYDEIDTIVSDLKCDIPVVPPECDNCTIINNVGYKKDPDNCNCWIQCIQGVDYNYQIIKQCCDCGLFWDNTIMTCVPAKQTTCINDPCLKTGVEKYAFKYNCRSYWTCASNRTDTTLCCADGTKFDSTSLSCEQDVLGGCNKECPCVEDTTAQYICTSTWDPTDPRVYFVHEFVGAEPTKMNCPDGTVFSNASCHCIHSYATRPPKPDCDITLDIRCTEYPLIDHAQDVHISNEGVSVDTVNGQCLFGGSQRLLVQRFANMDWRHTLAVYTEFYVHGSVPNNNVVIVSNTDCAEPSSIEIRLIRGTNDERIVEAIIRLKTGTVTITHTYTPFETNKLYLTYDGKKVIFTILSNNGIVSSKSVDANGNIIKCRCGLQIGYGWKNRYITGRIYDLKIWTDCIPKNFHPT